MPRPDTRSQEAQSYRRWYKLKAWAGAPSGLRWQCLLGALFTCKSCGWVAKASETHKLVADHITPHRGDWALFWDAANLQCLCEKCHSAAKQQEERLGYSATIGSDGWPVDAMHPANGGKPTARPSWRGPMSHPDWFRPVYVPMTIVCGPPASGKSTYVAKNMATGDVLIELDAIAKEVFGKPVRLISTKQRMDCLRIRNDRLGKFMRKVDAPPRMLWLIVAEPLADARQWWADTVRPSVITVIATPADECIARAERDEDTIKRRGQDVPVSIRQWWAKYKPRQGDTVITP